MGADLRLGTPVASMRELLAGGGFDAVFVGTGAPKGKELSLPGRAESDRIHIGIAWLESVAFEHVDTIGERVLIIGVGNTAMDCCRTSLRLGAKNVKVMARKPRGFFKASVWELEDAEEEQVEIIVNHAPKSFVVEGGKLKGMTFERLEYEMDGAEIRSQRVAEEVFIPCDDVILAIGQENAFPVDRARPRHRVRQVGRAEARRRHLRVDAQGRLLRRRRGVRAQEHHLGGRARPPGRDLDPQALRGRAARPSACRAASTCRAARSACTSGRTRTTTTPRRGG